MIKHIFIAICMLPVMVFAAGGAKINVSAPIDFDDKASLQRGAKTFVNNCLNCHSANYMRYNRLLDIGLSEDEVKNNLMFTTDKIGDPMQIAMDPDDAKEWFGVTPPDLTVEVRAKGADWVYAYMQSFYKDETTTTGWNNLVFDKVAMPHVLYQLQGEQVLNHDTHQLELRKPGKLSSSEYNAVIGDLTNYMAYMAEPAKQARQTIGLWVLLFLAGLLLIVKAIKKAYWKDIR